MTKYREILRLTSLGLSQRNIVRSLNVSQKTVAKVQKRACEMGLAWPLEESLTDEVLAERMFPSEKPQVQKKMPDFKYIEKELLRANVNKKLLWTEYLEECRQSGENPLMYSQFCYHIHQYEEKARATMHVPRKPGIQIEVDWAGDPAEIIDQYTGEITKAWLFVGAFSYSTYAFVEAFTDEKQNAWIKAHVHMYSFFGGVTPILVPDNASTATDRHDYDWYSPKLIKSYEEMAIYYNTAILPARIESPDDKPVAEGTVKNISTWITAALRNEQFFSLSELNSAIRKKLQKYNNAPFQKREGTRSSVFSIEEKPLLMPLPAVPYEPAEFRQATVLFNYHVSADKMFYSVPYKYIREKVTVRLTESTVEIFKGQQRIASHKRLYGRPGQYSTVTEHMPPDHRFYLDWDGDRFRRWASKIGSNTYKATDAILRSGRIEQQNYRACMGLLKLADKYTPEKLEDACRTALEYSNSPSYKSIKNILAVSKGDGTAPVSSHREDKGNQYGITRGAKHYGGGHNDESGNN